MTSGKLDDALVALQIWYDSNCNGEWEHEYGISISTVDNPGWAVSIPLAETSLESRSFVPVEFSTSRDDWLHCRVSESKFLGDGDSMKLYEIVRMFVEWASESTVE